MAREPERDTARRKVVLERYRPDPREAITAWIGDPPAGRSALDRRRTEAAFETVWAAFVKSVKAGAK